MSQKIFITSMTSEGEGIGSLEGLKVFVDGALPGEECLIEIIEQKKNYARGKLLSLIKPSQSRMNPICPLFGICGGCQIMHLEYGEQLNVKQKRVEEALKRIGGLTVDVQPCRASPQPLYYRNKIQLPVSGNRMGLYRKNSHEIVPIEECFIQEKQGNVILDKLTPLITGLPIKTILIRHGGLVVLVTANDTPLENLGKRIMEEIVEVKGVIQNINPTANNVVLGRVWKTLAGVSHIHEELLGKTFKISPGAFFQVNTAQAEQLFSEALKLASLKKSDRIWDAFCGVGVLGLLAADHVNHVVGTECVASAIADAKENARLNGFTNASFHVAHAEEKIIDADVTFLNPPRKGCEPSLLQQLTSERIIYISCDPATLARDLSLLTNRGYQIEIVQPFDMFPQTMHVETLIALSRVE